MTRPDQHTVRLMSAKLHRVAVTSTHKDYVGSITIDAELLDRVGILPLEEVEIVNVTNGKRWSTYALPGAKGQVSPNGGGAWMCEPGDILIIFAYAWRARAEVVEGGHTARVMLVDGDNRPTRVWRQVVAPRAGAAGFDLLEHPEGVEA